MQLRLIRDELATEWTLGKFYVDGNYYGETCEDTVREIPGVPVSQWKQPKVTAIPAGEYEVVLRYSPKYKRITPHLKDVDGFEWVLIHSGNSAKDTDGCILLGRNRIKGGVQDCATINQQLVLLLQVAEAKGEKSFISVH